MAVIQTGSIVSDIRGSVASETYARNQGGLFVRQRVTPANPNSQAQQEQRRVTAQLSVAWSATLTEAQRSAWRQYAHAYPRPNQWGERSLTNGYPAFLRHNAYAWRVVVIAAWPAPPDPANIPFKQPPPGPGLHPPIITFSAAHAADTVTIALPPTNYDPPWADLALYAFVGQTVTLGRNYYSGPWRFIDWNEYNGAWDHDPWTIAHPWGLDADNRVFIYLVAQHHTDGALSTRFQAHANTA